MARNSVAVVVLGANTATNWRSAVSTSLSVASSPRTLWYDVAGRAAALSMAATITTVPIEVDNTGWPAVLCASSPPSNPESARGDGAAARGVALINGAGDSSGAQTAWVTAFHCSCVILGEAEKRRGDAKLKDNHSLEISSNHRSKVADLSNQYREKSGTHTLASTNPSDRSQP